MGDARKFTTTALEVAGGTYPTQEARDRR